MNRGIRVNSQANSRYKKLENRIRLVLAFDVPANLQEFTRAVLCLIFITVCSICLGENISDCQTAFRLVLLPFDQSWWVVKKPILVWFSGLLLLAYGHEISWELEWSNFELKFCPSTALIVIRKSLKFAQEQTYPCRDISLYWKYPYFEAEPKNEVF